VVVNTATGVFKIMARSNSNIERYVDSTCGTGSTKATEKRAAARQQQTMFWLCSWRFVVAVAAACDLCSTFHLNTDNTLPTNKTKRSRRMALLQTKQKNQSKLSLFFQPASALLLNSPKKRIHNDKRVVIPATDPQAIYHDKDDYDDDDDDYVEDLSMSLSELKRKHDKKKAIIVPNDTTTKIQGQRTTLSLSSSSSSSLLSSNPSRICQKSKTIPKLPRQPFTTNNNPKRQKLKSDAVAQLSFTQAKENTSSKEFGMGETYNMARNEPLISANASATATSSSLVASPHVSGPPKRNKRTGMPSSSSVSSKLPHLPQLQEDDSSESTLDPDASPNDDTNIVRDPTPPPLVQGSARAGSRYRSSSSMDYSPSTIEERMQRRFPGTTTMPTSQNIVHHLIHRTTVNTHPRGNPTLRQVPSPTWKSPSWLHLQPVASSVSRTTTVDHLAWDRMGVLLATASNATRTISIYDWDMVRAAHQEALNEKQRCRVATQRQRNQKQPKPTSTHNDDDRAKDEDMTRTASSSLSSSTTSRSQWSIPPILVFSVPHAVTSLAWNPYNLDQLAVGFQYVVYSILH
jgi:hypothetical protein